MDTARFRVFFLFFSFFCPLFRPVIGNPLSCPMIPNKYYRISNQASNFLPMYHVSFRKNKNLSGHRTILRIPDNQRTYDTRSNCIVHPFRLFSRWLISSCSLYSASVAYGAIQIEYSSIYVLWRNARRFHMYDQSISVESSSCTEPILRLLSSFVCPTDLSIR